MSDNIQCTKCGKTGIDPDTHSCLKDYLALKEHIIHCKSCGSSWYDDGFTSSCPQCANRELGKCLDWERSAKENAYEYIEDTRKLKAENATLLEKIKAWEKRHIFSDKVTEEFERIMGEKGE